MATPGQLIGSGRTADVFDLGDGSVLRRYRQDRDVADEARVMSAAADAGIPVPHVLRAQGRDLVLEFLPGSTLLAQLLEGVRSADEVADILVELIRLVGATPAARVLQGAPDGLVLVHHDLHPDNVMVTARGPVLIDWDGARAGSEGEDLAHLIVLLAGAVSDPAADPAVARVAGLLALAVLARCSPPRDALLAEAAAERESIPGFTASTALELARRWVRGITLTHRL